MRKHEINSIVKKFPFMEKFIDEKVVSPMITVFDVGVLSKYKEILSNKPTEHHYDSCDYSSTKYGRFYPVIGNMVTDSLDCEGEDSFAANDTPDRSFNCETIGTQCEIVKMDFMLIHDRCSADSNGQGESESLKLVVWSNDIVEKYNNEQETKEDKLLDDKIRKLLIKGA